MFGIVFRSLARRSEVSTVKSFESINDCFKFVESNTLVATQDLYDAFKYLSTDTTSRREALSDERFPSLLNQLDSRLGTLNSSYLGNFALRLVLLFQNRKYLSGEGNQVNVEQAKALLEKIATTVVDKGASVKEVSQVAYAAVNMGLTNHPIYDFEKQQLTLNIDSATPDCLNLSLQTAFKRSNKDRVYLALLCEKLSELTDRFTSNDVVTTLRSLHRTGLLKGFLLRRLLSLMMDNLDQFTPLQLVQSSYRFASLKFFTPSNFKRVHDTIKPKFDELPERSKVELLAASYLSNLETTDEDGLSLLESVKFDKNMEIGSLTDYIYASTYYRKYDGDLQEAVSELLSRTPFVIKKYALHAKEVLDSLSLESNLKVDLPESWKEALDNAEKSEKERNEKQPFYQETKNVLEQSGKFKFMEKVGPYLVTFVDHERKVCLDLEFPNLTSNLSLKSRNIDALGYKVGVLRYWEWRRLKTEASQASYISKMLHSMSK